MKDSILKQVKKSAKEYEVYLQKTEISEMHIQKNKIGFILLNNNLWLKEPEKIAFTIAHEVAHAFKRHHLEKFPNNDERIKQEKEADRLAMKWLSEHYKRDVLEKYSTRI